MVFFNWIGANIGTILISLGLAALVAGIVVKMVLDKKKAKAGKAWSDTREASCSAFFLLPPCPRP